jgi:hypothetical protein
VEISRRRDLGNFEPLPGDIEPIHLKSKPPELRGKFPIGGVGAIARREYFQGPLARADRLQGLSIAQRHLGIIRLLRVGRGPLSNSPYGIGGRKLRFIGGSSKRTRLSAAAGERRQGRGREERKRYSAARAC